MRRWYVFFARAFDDDDCVESIDFYSSRDETFLRDIFFFQKIEKRREGAKEKNSYIFFIFPERERTPLVLQQQQHALRTRARRDEKTNAFPEEKKDVVLRDAARVETSDVVDARVVVVVVVLLLVV